MTPQEQILLLTMLAKMETRHRALIDLLKSKAILTQEEIAPFEYVAEADIVGKFPSLVRMTEEWGILKDQLGVGDEEAPK